MSRWICTIVTVCIAVSHIPFIAGCAHKKKENDVNIKVDDTSGDSHSVQIKKD
jgi:hypothetical protein